MLILALVSSDSRVREQVALHLSSRPSAELASAGKQMTDLASLVIDAVRDQTLAHTPLVAFIVVAGALLLFMLRT